MQRHINAARDNVQKIVKASQAKYNNNKIRVGFVGYRDYMDAERFIVTPFSTETEKVIEEMKKIFASGGGDIPEDVHGGLEVKY